MSWFCKSLVRFLKAEDGPTAVEYAVMLALIIVVCVAAVGSIGSRTDEIYRNEILANALDAGGSS
ncbi:MAG: Flp family type IVb pilin [Gemmataceae bacterium]